MQAHEMWLALLLASLCLRCSASSQQQLWDEQRDDLSEYQLDRSASSVRSRTECMLLAQSQHQAVEFSQSDGACRMFSCQLGWSGCRKCRNARNSSLPLLLVRRLDQLGRSCWQTFQHRVDGSVDFYRNWTDYQATFGQGEDLNYWMGLEAIHQLTKDGDRRVRWEISMWNGSWFWWENLFFAVQGSDQFYRALIGLYDTDRSSSLMQSASGGINNQQFSTPDSDHDSASGSCAIIYQGSWWYNACHSFNPNGRYFTPPLAFNLTGSLWAEGITIASPSNVYPFNHYYSMKTCECMVTALVD